MVVEGPSDYTKILHNISVSIQLSRQMSITSRQNTDGSAKIFKTFRKLLNALFFLRNISPHTFHIFALTQNLQNITYNFCQCENPLRNIAQKKKGHSIFYKVFDIFLKILKIFVDPSIFCREVMLIHRDS